MCSCTRGSGKAEVHSACRSVDGCRGSDGVAYDVLLRTNVRVPARLGVLVKRGVPAGRSQQETHSTTGEARRVEDHAAPQEHAVRSRAPTPPPREAGGRFVLIPTLANTPAETRVRDSRRPEHERLLQRQQRSRDEPRLPRTHPELPSSANVVPGQSPGAFCAKANVYGCRAEHASGPHGSSGRYRTARSPRRQVPAGERRVRDGGESASGPV